MKVAVVRLAFMASLNVMTNGAVGETPVAMLAGTVERIVGCACAQHQLSSKAKQEKKQTRRLRLVEGWERLMAKCNPNDFFRALRASFVSETRCNVKETTSPDQGVLLRKRGEAGGIRNTSAVSYTAGVATHTEESGQLHR